MVYTKEQIAEKVSEIETKLGVKVTPFLFRIAEDDECLFFTKQADRLIKMRVIDKHTVSRTQAGEMLLEATLLKEYSDSRVATDDDVYISACELVIDTIKFYQDTLKKK